MIDSSCFIDASIRRVAALQGEFTPAEGGVSPTNVTIARVVNVFVSTAVNFMIDIHSGHISGKLTPPKVVTRSRI